MPHNGQCEFRLAKAAVDHCVPEDRLDLIEDAEWAWIDLRASGHGWHLMFRCPVCHEFGTLWQDGRGHSIDPRGGLEQSVLHSFKYAGVEKCGSHYYPVFLAGYVDKRTTP